MNSVRLTPAERAETLASLDRLTAELEAVAARVHAMFQADADVLFAEDGDVNPEPNRRMVEVENRAGVLRHIVQRMVTAD